MEINLISLGRYQFTIFELIVYVLFSVFVLLWYFYKSSLRLYEESAAKLNGIPSYSIIELILASLGTRQRVTEQLFKISEKYGQEPHKVWTGSSFIVTISNPEDLKIVLNNSKSLGKGRFFTFYKRIIGESLFAAPVQKWKKHRRIMAPTFNSASLARYFPVFNETNKTLIKNLRKEVNKTQLFNIWDYISFANVDTVCQNAMSYNVHTESSNVSEFINDTTNALDLVVWRMFRPIFYSEIVYSTYLNMTGQQKLYESVQTLPSQLIKKKKENSAQRKITDKASTMNVMDEKNKPSKTFLDILLELNMVNGNFSDEDLRNEVLFMLVAGSDTTSATLCFCLLLLAIHPDIQSKVISEIYTVLGNRKDNITLDDTNKLIYMEQVIKETLRLFPIAPLLMRELQGDVKMASGNNTLPKGTICLLSVWTTHHSPELYQNPWTFNPENFNLDNMAKRHKYSFLGFSDGPRGCLGSKYALCSMKVSLCMFLQSYSVHTSIKLSDIKLKLGLLLRSVNGFPVTIKSRQILLNKNMNVIKTARTS